MSPATRRSCAALVIVASLAGCGRSALRQGGHVDPGTTGAGGSGAGGSDTGGSGASGGGTIECTTFGLEGLPRSFIGLPDAHERRPQIVSMRDDDAHATLFFGWDPVDQGLTPSRVGQATFEAWGAWPAEPLGPSFLVAPFGGDAFAAAPCELEAFAVVMPLSKGDPPSIPGGMLYDQTIGTKPPTTMIDTSKVFDPTGKRPVIFTLVGIANVTGYTRGDAGHERLALTALSNSFSPFSIVDGAACATTRLVGGATRSGDRALVAFASSRPWGTCLDPDGVDGPANEIQIGFFDSGLAKQPSSVIPGDDAVSFLRVLPRPNDEAWLVSQRRNPSKAPLHVEAARVDPMGQLASPAFVVIPDGATTAPEAASSGDLLAVAWIDSLDPGGSHVLVRLFDGSGAMIAEADAVPEGQSVLALSDLALFWSPAGDKLLVAWSEQTNDGVIRLRVARLGCVP